MANETELQVQEAQKQEVAEQDAERTRARAAFVPRTDIYETDDMVVVLADMPGVDENALDITLEKSVLTINGWVSPDKFEGYSPAYAEYRVGDYQRRFSLSNEIDQEQISATIKDGVLRVELPKAQPTTRKISIKAG